MITDQMIADLLLTTLTNQKKGKITDIAQEAHDYIVVPYFLTRKGGLIVKKGGQSIEETLLVNHGGSSKWVGLYNEDVITVIDHLKKMKVSFCNLTDNIAYDRTEIMNNRGEERVNNVILPRRHSMYMRIIKTMEENFFSTPNAEDDLTPWGLWYWIVKNATTGFNGGYPAGFTRIGNINLTEVPAFKNYTATYTDATKADLVTKMRRAHRQVHWKMPKNTKGIQGDTTLDRRIILCNEDSLEAFEDIGEAQNENLGRDVASMETGKGLKKNSDGDIVFRKIGIQWAEELDSDTTDPIVGLDMDTFHAMTRQGDNMRMGEFSNKGHNSHNVFVAHIDHSHQTICTNRRANYVIYKG